jgi:hypothetical protein
MKTIYISKGFFGNYEFRATSDNVIVNLQERKVQQNKWKTIETMSKAEFDKQADYMDIYNPYNRNPAHINNIVKRIKEKTT